MGRSGPKKFTESQHKGHAGIGLIHMLISEMGHEWHDRVVDVGVDGSIELRDPSTGLMSNQHVMVQSKASDDKFSGETDDGFWYLCDEEDIEYWMKSRDIPVILICSHPKERKAWWAHVQPWFEVPANRASRRIDFNKATQAFEGDFTGKLFAIADPHGVAHTPTAEKKHEQLVSNLLPVDVPDVVYVAKTKHRGLKAIYDSQRDSGLVYRSDFVLDGGRIYMWSPAEGTSLQDVVAGPITATPFGEIAAGDADDQRLAVWLLNAALKDDLSEDCRWNNRRKFLHFKATEDLTERRITSMSGKQRLVFKGYYQRADDPTRPKFYRHAALRAHFLRIDDEWFCELLPDYFFTDDGYAESKFADKNLAKMKRIEKNQARLSETLMWVRLLMGEPAPDLFYEAPPRILDFGAPVRFDLDRGITDKNWIAPDDDAAVEPTDEISPFTVAENDLFDALDELEEAGR
ncbi:DUF4365 domain-containing protein [Phycicoccus endophyticus]|uniref:DUF4365 domain-containing protein n=1 Tax=Phycicoccus endophyticus TaxID=1690220 RepID=A0A7G9QZR9_9MICO|nr:DUF4365 domain-containing protein [Phycicoccus endophyticus]NHI20039.1 DUF4365 domain-containing protein [Phycicoccus endophyticus]QNN48844.1 DUF4365 domain-containing protein [Phycicoccus endophyticus]GGL42377.1 hypothetical protein GCM10012283_26250 [Phycicoccus endophyticus]